MGMTFLSYFRNYAAVLQTFFKCFGPRRFFAIELARCLVPPYSSFLQRTRIGQPDSGVPTRWVARRKAVGKSLVHRPSLFSEPRYTRLSRVLPSEEVILPIRCDWQHIGLPMSSRQYSAS